MRGRASSPQKLAVRTKRLAAGALVASACCAAGVGSVLPTELGCQLQGTCDADSASIPGLAKEQNGPDVTPNGVPMDAGMYGSSWQSGPEEGHWLWFPGQRTYTIYPDLNDGGRLLGPYVFSGFISADSEPYTTPGSNFVQGAGNSVEFSGLPYEAGTTPDGSAMVVQQTYGFQVTNDTCSPYYLWLQVTPEAPFDPGAGDAGTDAGDSSSAFDAADSSNALDAGDASDT